ncbi:MAG: ATP phosphoribosyltransferase [Gammaproteobacteria bacterium]|nr:MAG: ATP phosphoribosyltransferase [Gammaproteobacteria bacterium]
MPVDNINGIKIAVAKGRIFEEAMPLLEQAGVSLLDNPEQSRKLILDTSDPLIKLVVIRSADVPTYVQYGAADLGVVGKDVLMEHGGAGLYEPLDLGIARCSMMIAGLPDAMPLNGRPRIATKYVNITRQYFAGRGEQVEIVKLYGSMELAPLAGLANLIVDLVDTGNTLKANGLVQLEKICDISARLIINQASLRLKSQPVKALTERLSAVVGKVV